MKHDINYWKHFLKVNKKTYFNEEEIRTLKVLITDCWIETGLLTPTEAMQAASELIKRCS